MKPGALFLAVSSGYDRAESHSAPSAVELARANQTLRAQIAERVRAEEALRESEEKFRAFVETTHEWIWSIDRHGRYTYTNPAVKAMLGYEPDEIMGRSFLDYIHEEDRGPIGDMFSVFVEDQWGWKELVLRWRHKDGSYRYLERNATPILDGKGRLIGYRGTDRDITERKQAERILQEERAQLALRVEERTAELQAANDQLAKAARLKDEFLASMSHELRTPLNAILGLSEVLEEQVYGPLNAKQTDYLRNIQESGRHLLSLINDILDLSKIEAGKCELTRDTVNVAAVCQASLRLVKETAERKRLKLRLQVDPQVTTLWADERRLKQILVNLLGNAVKFTPEGGTVGLDVACQPDDTAVTFAVWDTGIGIAPEDLDRLFKPFVQLDSRLSRRYSGTGLGLALVRRMVEMHGGSVGLESQVGRGSRFTFTIPAGLPINGATAKPGNHRAAEPLVVESTPPATVDLGRSVPERPSEPQPGRSPVILLAEDSEINIESMSAFLSAKGFEVVVASQGEEVIDLSREHHPDLILMDVQMPGMDGLEATRCLRADPELENVPIISITAMAMPGDRERCLAAGATDYMSKPLHLRELVNRIHQHLNGSAGRSESL